MSTALEQMHEIEPHIQVGRARAGVLMLILSDAISIVAILAAGGYLSALNVTGQFRAGVHAPAFLPGLLVAIVLVLSGLAYYWWDRGIQKNEGAGQPALFILAGLLMLVASVGQIWIGATLGYASPFHAYASIILLLTWYSAVHLVLTVIVGILLLGRIFRSRLVGQTYIAEVVGYWWYYTVIAYLLMWVFVLVYV
jgi:heme/copper-type cytochrome/quinol oxidase subunit 3